MLRQSSQVPYQRFLRVLGRVVDQQDGAGLTVLELPDGFLVRYQPPPPEPVTAREFSVAAIEDLEREQRRARRRVTEARYDDVLRAAGFALERAGAYTVLVEDTRDDLIVSYQFDDPARGYQLHKRIVVLSGSDQEGLITEARSRRRKRSRFFR